MKVKQPAKASSLFGAEVAQAATGRVEDQHHNGISCRNYAYARALLARLSILRYFGILHKRF